MIIYWSMIAAIALCAAANYMTAQNIAAKNRFGQSKFWTYLPMLYIIFWTGIRTQFVDTAAYIRTYADIPASSFQSITFSLYPYHFLVPPPLLYGIHLLESSNTLVTEL